ncbi:hypothetical protein [Methylobacterium sp. J-092]|uniref:hypothetical protein n=1 Tax=Methylobacterium sp. J-092 TaxID=2836667 RepID=UPI001FB8B9EB|nr:hypothetical protein [Methylobacterium sp. J-092]MCJ2009788.1 hypothetical protein [Methylobacterium sp. J-092]
MVGYLHNNLETIPGNFRRYALSAAHEPTAEQKALLLARRDEIDRGLAEADVLTIREQVGILRSSMATAPLGEEAMTLAKRAFILVLSKYPAWAIVEASMRFLDGRAGNKTYAPTAAEMAEVCRRLISEDLAERARINAILDAEIYHAPTEGERAEVERRHQAFVEETARAADARRARQDDRSAQEVSPERAQAIADLERRRLRREAAAAATEGAEA